MNRVRRARLRSSHLSQFNPAGRLRTAVGPMRNRDAELMTHLGNLRSENSSHALQSCVANSHFHGFRVPRSGMIGWSPACAVGDARGRWSRKIAPSPFSSSGPDPAKPFVVSVHFFPQSRSGPHYLMKPRPLAVRPEELRAIRRESCQPPRSLIGVGSECKELVPEGRQAATRAES